jgi:hypothetical protein
MGSISARDASSVDIVEFGNFTVTDYRNGDLFVKLGNATIRISPSYGGMLAVTASAGLTLEPTAVNQVPAFRTRKLS